MVLAHSAQELIAPTLRINVMVLVLVIQEMDYALTLNWILAHSATTAWASL